MFSVVLVLALSDNYEYLLIDEASRTVDPVEPEKLIAKAQELDVQITTVLTTHSHWDHAGGNNKILALIPDLKVYGGKGDNAEGVMMEVGEGDVIEIGQLKVQTLFTPCHTPGHVCYYIPGTPGIVFSGDTMFVGGCGNFNNGTPQQMYENMLLKLGSLPRDTLVYVGHEYTVRNFQFGLFAEPDNERLKEKLEWAKTQRASGLPTIPSTIGDEWDTNPFMRVKEETIKKFTGKENPVEGMLAVRRLKDEWGKTN